VATTAQLLEAGLTKDGILRRVRAGRLYPLHRGVYAVGHEALTWRSHLIAAVYACGAGGVASHRAAGALHGLARSTAIEITAGRGCKPKRGVVIHRPRGLETADRATVDHIPVTTVARTLVDLADVLSEDRLAKALHQAEILRVFDLDALGAATDRAGQRRGRGRLARVLAAYRPEPHFLRSEAERRLERLCTADSLPQPQFNVWVGGYELDAYWPDERFAVELDVFETHGTREAFERDRLRQEDLKLAGIEMTRITGPRLDREPAEVIERVARLLSQRQAQLPSETFHPGVAAPG